MLPVATVTQKIEMSAYYKRSQQIGISAVLCTGFLKNILLEMFTLYRVIQSNQWIVVGLFGHNCSSLSHYQCIPLLPMLGDFLLGTICQCKLKIVLYIYVALFSEAVVLNHQNTSISLIRKLCPLTLVMNFSY